MNTFSKFYSFLILSFGLLLAGCNSDLADLNAIVFTPVSIKTSNIDVSNDRILIYGTRSDGREAFAKFYTSAPELNLELRRGNWSFYGLAYSGTVIQKCSKLETGVNSGKRIYFTLDFQNSNCADDVFLGTDPTLNAGINPTIAFPISTIEFCESVSGITTSTDQCTDNLSLANRKQARGHATSFRYSFMGFTKTGGSYSFNDSIQGGCANGLPAGGSLSGLAVGFLGFNIPAGDPTLAPFYIRLEVFTGSTNCSSGTPYVVNLPNGLRTQHEYSKYVVQPAVNSIHKLYIKSSGDEICTGTNTTAEFAGGDGTQLSPYLICNENQLYHIFPAGGNYNTYANYSYKLLKDLDISNRSIGTNFFPEWQSCVDPGSNFIPIGTAYSGLCTFGSPSSVHFDGGGKTIKGLRSSRTGTVNGLYYALRGSVGNPSHVRRLTMRDAEISITSFGGIIAGDSQRAAYRQITLINPVVTTGGSFTGGITGISLGDTFSEITITGAQITGGQYTGGIVGAGRAIGGVPTTISNVSVDGDIVSIGVNSTIGGIAGEMNAGGVLSTISLSKFTGSITGDQEIGGLVGKGTTLRIVDSYVDSTTIKSLAATNARLGGLAGNMITYMAGAGIYSSYFYGSLMESCILNDVNCRISSIVGTTDGSFVPSHYTTAIYNLSGQILYTAVNYGSVQDDAEFITSVPLFVDNTLADITPNFSPFSWEFRNGLLPRLLVEP
ncbi:MAG: hypothetical protein V4598_07255 [Bdellovibrionota bacterium]